MYKMNKKGLSDVITTVLIILLVLAAVVLIWSFIRKPLTQAGQTVDLSTQCLQKSVEAVNCKILVNGTTVVTYRNTGDLAHKITVILTYTDGTTSSATDEFPATSDSLGIQVDSGKTASKALATAVIKKDDGSDYSCNPVSTEVNCVA